MFKLIIGVKGTGKTKALINMVNEAVDASHGDVVCIEKGTKLRFDVKYQARLINIEEYGIESAEALTGFVAGILASDHDVTEIFVDSALKICKNDVSGFEKFAVNINNLVKDNNVVVYCTVSLPIEEASETLRQFI